MINKYKIAKKITYKGQKYDSEKELKFYKRYLEPLGDRVLNHPTYVVRDSYTLGGYKGRKRTYSPDFVVLAPDGTIEHVYDVKAGITEKTLKSGQTSGKVYIDASMKKSIDDYQRKYNHPVELVAVYAHDFRMTIINTTVSVGVYYFTNVDYDVTEIIGE
ncbi:DUF1064 domain-containing protein [Limosilactobacillus equigenerosi]|uniref:Uncharacterized protein n=2 Tax=Limosilactobacillus TaxID=2742598 RepID=A0A0R1UTF9_9LACO|nr:DUF1064 domain-containing protein [Limosilactobacillus equigenerosi]KRL94245.1 hypothetical protein FC21_GL001374 [Limosilactobacillus equigenerosi DSM 18793 = JCM 14505]